MTNEEMQKEREELLERVRKAEQGANESQAEAAVYREFLEELYKAADQAIAQEDLKLLHTITGKLTFLYMPNECHVKEWGKLFLHAYIRDAGWLESAKQSLEKIKAYAERLDVAGNPADAELKERILEAARDGLIPHI